MCKICDDWKSGNIDNKRALGLVGQKLYNCESESQSAHLMSLVDKILDKEIPVSPVNKDAEETFWEQTHGTEENE